MKIHRLDAHDRFQYFKKQNFDIGECCQHLIDQRPFGDHAFYIFAHPRTEEDGVTKCMLWQPRLTKPFAQENSMLFKVKPGSDNVRVIWMIPARELWQEFEKGKMMENEMIINSIYEFKNNKKKLEAKEEDDLDDATIDKIYREICIEAQRNREMFKIIT